MPTPFRVNRKIVLLAALALSGAAFAGGNHADGHHHGSGHSHGDQETDIGKPGVATKAARTITIEMNDKMRFTPASIQARQGETIRFVVKNMGQLKHELSLGTQKELREHLELMRKFPDMEHDEPNSVSLAPGQQGEIVWQFTKSGTVHFACLIPGHYEAGMKGAVQVGEK